MDPRDQIRFAHRIATGFLGDPFLAEEAAQNVLLRLVKADRRGDVQRSLQDVIYVAVKRECLRLQAGRRRERAALADLFQSYERGAGGSETDLDRAEEQARLHGALQALDEHQREAVVLKIFGGMTHEEIARAAQVPLGTAQSRFRLGVERLRAIMGAQND